MEVDGEHLLRDLSQLTIEVWVNADCLPFEVRQSDSTGVFEGLLDEIDGRKLEIGK